MTNKTVQTQAHGNSRGSQIRKLGDSPAPLKWVIAGFALFIISVGITQLQLDAAADRQAVSDARDTARDIYLANLRAYTAEVGAYTNCVTLANGTNKVRDLFLFLVNAPQLEGSELVADFKVYMDSIAPEQDVSDCKQPIPPEPPASLVDAGVVIPTSPSTTEGQ